MGNEISYWVEKFNDEDNYGTQACMEAADKICEAAGLSTEWEQADGENFESVLRQAAQKLNVTLNI